MTSAPKSQPMTAEPTPGQLQAWADEAQACVDSGELIITDHEKANATIMVLRSYASLKGRIAELEANEKAYEEIIGPMTYREVAGRIMALEGALERVVDFLGYAANEGKSAAIRECNAHNAWKTASAALEPKP